MAKTKSSEAARLLQSLRKNKRGGRPRVMYACAGCSGEFSARDMRLHLPMCRKKKAA
jgi:hypothetical protein